jgi:surface polysaccharide O-acyltransferase-like enzyme
MKPITQGLNHLKVVKDQRNKSIDSYRLLLAFLVVCIHCDLVGFFYGCIDVIARIAVPSFFLISGFFMFNRDIHVFRKHVKLTINRLLRIFLLASVFYLIFGMVSTFVGEIKVSIHSYLSEIFSFKSIVKLVIFNVPIYCVPLWYLLAYIYVLIICYFFAKFLYKHYKFCLFMSLLFLLICVMFASYFRLFWGGVYFGHEIVIYSYIVRNAYFEGLPLFLIGFILAKHSEKFLLHKKKGSDITLLVLIIVFAILTLIERFLIVQRLTFMYISTIPLVICIFVLLIRNDRVFSKTIIPKLGSKYSLYIYIYHLAVINVFNYFSTKFGFADIIYVQYFYPVIIYAITLIFSILFVKIRDNLLLWYRNIAHTR